MNLRCGGSRLKKAAVFLAVALAMTAIFGAFTESRADYYDAYGNYYTGYGYYDAYGNYYGYYNPYGYYGGYGYYDAYGNYYTDYGYYDIYGNYYAYGYGYYEPEVSEDGLTAKDPYGYVDYVPLFYKTEVDPALVKEPAASIRMDWVPQNPEMPNGCEIVATTTALNYLGFGIDKISLARDYFRQKDKKLDFRKYYIGDPLDYSGIGCWAGAVIDAANRYLIKEKSDLRAFDYSNYLFEDLLNEVAKGYPVIIWATQSMNWPFYGNRYNIDGEEIVYISQEHCLVLNGYDLKKKVVMAADPLEGQVEYDMDLFKKRYAQLGYQAVIIKTAKQQAEAEKGIASWPFQDRFLPPEKYVRGCKGFDGVSEAD